jgi:uncharacterized membrane protein
MASPSPAPGQTNLGVAPNVGGLLCYVPCCIGFIFSVVAAIVEKQSKFVRFHAFQSLLLHAAAFVCSLGVQVASMAAAMASGFLGFLVSLIGMVIGLGLLGLCIFLMIKTNNNEEIELPVIGEMARKWA